MIGDGIGLFERLCDLDADVLKRRQITSAQDSVKEALVRILSTRRQRTCYTDPPTILDYGIKDWSDLSVSSKEDGDQLAAEVIQAINAFEPRLQHVDVEIIQEEHYRGAWPIRISGIIVIHPIRQPVVFIARLQEGADVSLAEQTPTENN